MICSFCNCQMLPAIIMQATLPGLILGNLLEFSFCCKVFLFFNISLSFLFFFFFQAEDGIRDGTVTGVQTCALPISARLCRRLATVPRSVTMPLAADTSIAEPPTRGSQHSSATTSRRRSSSVMVPSLPPFGTILAAARRTPHLWKSLVIPGSRSSRPPGGATTTLTDILVDVLGGADGRRQTRRQGRAGRAA